MKTFAKTLALASLAAALLAGCATPAYVSPVEVTRFLGSTPDLLRPGPIAVRPGAGMVDDPALVIAFQTALTRELGERGYVVVGGNGPQVAEFWVERFVERPGGSRSPVSVGVGGSTGTYGSGVGLGVGINLGGSGPREQVDSQLRVVIRPSGAANALWEGRARFSATTNSEAAELGASAARLADALFDDFPGRSGETIEVP